MTTDTVSDELNAVTGENDVCLEIEGYEAITHRIIEAVADVREVEPTRMAPMHKDVNLDAVRDYVTSCEDAKATFVVEDAEVIVSESAVVAREVAE